jgi:hypothetical protein
MPIMKPMGLLSETQEHMESLIQDLNWAAYDKKNGRSMLASWDGSRLRLYNQSCNEVEWSGLVRQQLEERLPKGVAIPVLHGELEPLPGGGYDTGIFWVWTHQGEGNTLKRAADLAAMNIWGGNVQLCLPTLGTEAKQKLYDELYAEGAEGLVFWRLQALYPTGTGRTSDVIKYKFVESADCWVRAWRHTTTDVNGYRHGVAEVCVLDETGIPVYLCSPHIRESEILDLERCDAEYGKASAILEVEYLYSSGGSLVQPISKRVRWDKIGIDNYAEVVTRKSQLRVSRLFRSQEA